MSKAQDKLNEFTKNRQSKIDELVEKAEKAKAEANKAFEASYIKIDADFADGIKKLEDELAKLQKAVDKSN